jgi:hypothetical protein
MRSIGLFLVLFGWLLAINGYTIEHVTMIAAGVAMVAGSYYLERR